MNNPYNWSKLEHLPLAALHTKSISQIPGAKITAAEFKPAEQLLLLELTLPFALSCQEELAQQFYLGIVANYADFGLSSAQELEVVDIKFTWKVSERAHVAQRDGVRGVKNIIAVSSAKGGVGKSSVCVNLAHAIAASGARVGILDADVYGPSIPHMLDAAEAQPISLDQKTMEPIQVGNIYANSIGFLVGEDDPTIWRGPMASQYLKQLLAETNWPELDYLLIDMPPGTGDIQLTVAQNLGITAAIVVTTPQGIALLDVVKGVNMFRTLNVPVLGVVENMAMFCCPNCGHQTHIFGQELVNELSELLGCELLASIPLDPVVGADLDAGHATVTSRPQHQLTQTFLKLADRVCMAVFEQCKSVAPSINIKQL